MGLFLLLAVMVQAAGSGAVRVASLAEELYGEGAWALCIRECRRALIRDPEQPRLRLLKTLSALRLERDVDRVLEELSRIAASEAPVAVRVEAAYEEGRARAVRGEVDLAFDRLRFAFLHAEDRDWALRSGTSLFLLMRQHRGLRREYPALDLQMQSNRRLYTWSLQQAERLTPPADPVIGRVLSLPGVWVTALYRRQVGPAIGMRCSCEPSCSEYFLQACRQHGVLGFAMQADRFFREPSLVRDRHNPVWVNGEIRYADPVSDHDFWHRNREK